MAEAEAKPAMHLMHRWVLLPNTRLALLHHERRLGGWTRAQERSDAGGALRLAGRAE